MTRAEFEGGWAILRGAGLQGAKEADPGVYHSALETIDAKTWGVMVKRAVRECAFFPAVSSLLEIYFAVGRDERAAAIEVKVAPRSRLLPRPPLGGDFPMKDGEGLFAYLERRAFWQGDLPKSGYAGEVSTVKAFPSLNTEQRERIESAKNEPRDPGEEG